MLNLAIQREQLADGFLFIIKTFDNIENALKYSEPFVSDPQVFQGIDKNNLQFFLITEKNLSVLISDKDPVKYLLFYEKFYTGK